MNRISRESSYIWLKLFPHLLDLAINEFVDNRKFSRDKL